jgi:hypothetical protein
LPQDVFRARLADEPSGALWLRTGDLGFLSSSAAVEGELFFVGRAKDVIVVRGRNFAPEDIEAAVTAAAPALRPGCAAAFALEDEGAEGAAVVLVCEVRDAGLAGAAAGVAVAAARAGAAAAGVTLAHVALLPPRSIPKTTSGKVRRFECRRRFVEGSLPTIPAAAAAQFGVLLPHAPPGGATGAGDAARREGMLQPGGAAALGALPRRRRRAALRRAIASHVAAAWSLPLPAAHTDLLASGLDSAAAAALHGALEMFLGAPLPRTLLLDARTPAALALAADAARWPPCAAEDARDAEDAAAAWDAGDDDDCADASSAASAASAAAAAAPARTPAQRRAGALLALFCASVLLAHVVTMSRLRAPDGSPLRWWSTQAPAYINGAGYRPGWLPGALASRRIDVAHWRLLEWARTVLPIQLGLNGGAAALARAAAATASGGGGGGAARGWRRGVPSQRALAAAAGLAHAAALHGVWALPLLVLVLANFALGATCRRLRGYASPSRARAARHVTAWALALVPMGVYNALEPGNLLWRHTADVAASTERRFLHALLGVGARPYEGLLAATSFTANRTFRYIAMRCLSYHVDDAEAQEEEEATPASSLNDLNKEGWFGELELFLAYVLYAPLYLCGPVMTFKAFKASPAAQGGAAAAAAAAAAASAARKPAAAVTTSATEMRAQPPAEEAPPAAPSTPPLHPFPSARPPAARASAVPAASDSVGWRAAAVTVGGAVAAAVALEVCLHGVYAPSAVFYPSFSHGSRALGDALKPWDWAVNAFAFLTATWLTSAIVFAVPRGIAAAARVPAPHDTPLWWTAASVSCRKHWAHFHASLFNVFMRYIFLPLGGGTSALLATVTFSTFIHGFHPHWALWGLGNALTLAAERAAARRWRWYASPGAPVRAANQAAAVTLMAALALGGELPAGALRSVAAFILAFAALNAAYLGR